MPCAAAVVAAAVAASPAAAVSPGLDGAIAFVDQRAGDSSPEVQRVALDGTQLLRLTNNSDNEQDPAWTPTGDRIVYSSNHDPGGNFNQELWLMGADGSGQTLLTNTTDPITNLDAAVSPDGTRVAFTSTRSGNQDIWIQPLAGGAATQLTTSSAVDAFPDWSPDGSRIVFASERTGNSEIWTMTPQGTDLRQLTDDARLDDEPSWSPDGTRIAFRRNDGAPRIWVMGTDGANPRRLTTGTSDEELQPSWAPAGTRLVFAERVGSVRTISVVNADGTGLTRVIAVTSSDASPSWQPLRPAPVAAALQPSTVVAGGPAFTLAVTGQNFVPGSRVRWNGADRPTTYGGPTRLTAQIPASDIAAPGTARVSVATPAPGGGASAELPFTVGVAVPPPPPGGDLQIRAAAATGTWRAGRFAGRIAVSGSVTRAARLRVTVLAGRTRLVRTVLTVGGGAFRLSARLPATTLPGPLRVTLDDAAPPAGQGALPSRTATATLPPARQGVVARAFLTTSPTGVAQVRIRRPVRVLYAAFRFAARPRVRRPAYTVVWRIGGFAKSFRVTPPAGRTVVAQIGSLGAGVLARGRWTATLRVNGVVVGIARGRLG